ncbi:MAG: diguanylate cyclase, partial [Rhizomicrobium sp.]
RVASRGTPLPRVTASLGIACHPVDGDNVVDLINSADTALYQAKSSGRNTVIATIPPGDVVLFDPRFTPQPQRA